MKKSTAMVEFQKNRKDISRQKVENTIRKLKRSKKQISKTEFCKMAGVSLQYLYKYPELLAEIETICIPSGRRKKRQTPDSKDTIITSLRAENKSLKNKIAEYDKEEKYKIRYENAIKRIEELEKQLKEAYNSQLDMDF